MKKPNDKTHPAFAGLTQEVKQPPRPKTKPRDFDGDTGGPTRGRLKAALEARGIKSIKDVLWL